MEYPAKETIYYKIWYILMKHILAQTDSTI